VATNSKTPTLDAIIDSILERKFKVEARFTSVEDRLDKVEAAVIELAKGQAVKVKAAPAVKAAPKAMSPVRKAATPKARPQVVARSNRQKAGSSLVKEDARIKAGEKLLKCTTCGGDGIWGQKKDGSIGACFDCFGRGKLTVTRAAELKARRSAASAA